MKIINITGGLGNQMFQYAFALALKNKFPNEEILIDTQHYNSIFFKHFKGINLHNGFEIEKVFPNAKLKTASPYKLAKLSYWIPNYVLSRLARRILPRKKSEYIAPYIKNYSYDRHAFENIESCYYEGYWQCVEYFKPIKEQLRTIFSHPVPNKYNSDLIKKIQGCSSVGIHVRRGDYLNEPEFRGICDIEYYRKSIRHILTKNPNCSFFIFSNDSQWCKENLSPLICDNEIIFVTGNKGKDSCWDMFLMTYCKNLIIANSSFSWWGAFLNNNAHIVCAPYPWLNRNCKIDLYENNWLKIK